MPNNRQTESIEPGDGSCDGHPECKQPRLDIIPAAVLTKDISDETKQGLTFKVAAGSWLRRGQNRKRRPFSPATVAGYGSMLNNLNLLLGEVPLGQITNAKVKDTLETIAAKPTKSKKPITSKTIEQHFNVIKLVIASIVDMEGEESYPRTWKYDFIFENISKSKPSQPCFTPKQIESIIHAARGQYAAMYALQAASGLRWSELLAIKLGVQSEDHTTISKDCKTIFVRRRIYKGKEGALKTDSAYRDVDLCGEMASYLKQFIGSRTAGFLFRTKSGQPISQRNILRDSMHKILYGHGFKNSQGEIVETIPGIAPQMKGTGCASHAFRRYRATHLRGSGVPEDITRFWLGHADQSITDRYSKVKENVEHRKSWADLVGIGFEIPDCKFLDEAIQGLEAEIRTSRTIFTRPTGLGMRKRSRGTGSQNDQEETCK
jgi:integrase